jgi:succinate-acetate transporter protein
MSFATIEIVTLLAPFEKPVPTNKFASEGMLFMVSVFTFMLWTLTFKMNCTINSLFFLLGSTCMLLSFGVRNEDVDRVGGWFGIATSVNAFVSMLCCPVLSCSFRLPCF